MIPIYLFIEPFKTLGMVIVGVSTVAFVAIAGMLKSRRERREVSAKKNIIPYRERFEQMKTEAEMKYGPSVEFLRPEMGIDDDPEAFEKAWRLFEQDQGKRFMTSR